MKRLHVHVGVADLDHSIRFYSTLFGAGPNVLKPDYAKWMLEDPRVNFAISTGQHAEKGDISNLHGDSPGKRDGSGAVKGRRNDSQMPALVARRGCALGDPRFRGYNAGCL